MSATVNLLLLAADNPAKVLQHLREDPSAATIQDEHGYSLVHAAASYNHTDLLKAVVNDYHVDVNIKDEDGETALFGIETVELAQLLVEELNADITLRGESGQSARERIAEDGEFPEVAVYLRTRELQDLVGGAGSHIVSENPATQRNNGIHPPAPLPEGMSVDFGTMAPEDAGELLDPEFKRRIDELAARDDFNEEEGQEALRKLVKEALGGEVGEERNNRQRTS
ncbi:related to ankyrins [Rhynchosporium agropyri]|uniref:Related to ankyrins n=1 Tax=Rhynchosporium agropyri TaxID=914238 RepID=A0A1E1KVK6_9HELO|nr:related to ankyrins [Rhynchosporium agropyri]